MSPEVRQSWDMTEMEKELFEERICICVADGMDEGTAHLVAVEQIRTFRKEQHDKQGELF